MQIFNTKFKNNEVILALGADSAGGFSVYRNGQISYQDGFGDLLDEGNFTNYSNSISAYLRNNKLKLDVVLIDLHPLFETVEFGEELAKKYQAELIKVQHHLAHIFSSYGEYLLDNNQLNEFIGIAADGTGLGFDEKIWGGEIFEIQSEIKRIGHLENQVLIGGEMAVREPVRVLVAVMNSFLEKEQIYKNVAKFYSANEFELLYNQLREKFNCIETSSVGRILDAVSVLLGFCENKSTFKHEPILLLGENSGSPFEIEPEVILDQGEKMFVLRTTPLFQYLIKNINKDKKRLAATAQLYIAKGIWRIVERCKKEQVFFAGGMANNKIIAEYLINKGIVINKQIARGDEGLSFGQLCYYLSNVSKNN